MLVSDIDTNYENQHTCKVVRLSASGIVLIIKPLKLDLQIPDPLIA